jgi:hypothetical protein
MQRLGFGGTPIKYKHFEDEDPSKSSVKRELFVFPPTCITLNSVLAKRNIWLFFLANTLIYYFLCIFLPIYFIIPCKKGGNHEWLAHIIYAAYTVTVFLFEFIMASKIKNVINEPGILSLNFSLLNSLLNSQVTKLTLYTDLLYMTISYSCEYYVSAAISAFFCLLHVLQGLIQIIFVWSEYSTARTNSKIKYTKNEQSSLLLKKKTVHHTTFINLLARYSYCTEMKTIAEILERFSTACAIKYKDVFVAQIIVQNSLKYLLQNLPHAILQLYGLITLPQHDLTTIGISLSTTLISLFMSFISAVTTQPSICNTEMLASISTTRYQTLLEKPLKGENKKQGCCSKIVCCGKKKNEKASGLNDTSVSYKKNEHLPTVENANLIDGSPPTTAKMVGNDKVRFLEIETVKSPETAGVNLEQRSLLNNEPDKLPQ